MDEFDVVVVGAGGAGLSAAVSAAEAGARVIVLESQKEVGGSTQLSAGVFTAGGSSVQQKLGIEDSPERFYQHYMDLNQWHLRPALIRAFCEAAPRTLDWLVSLGAEFPAKLSTNALSPGIYAAGVGDVWRTHAPVDQGYGLIQVLDRRRRKDATEVIFDTAVDDLVRRDGVVCGVRIGDDVLTAKSVVVTSGGFGSNPDLVAKYFPEALAAGDSLFTIAADGSQGDHMRFAQTVDASIVGDGDGLLLIAAAHQTQHTWQAGYPPESRLYVNGAGRRFIDEDVSYAVSSGIFAQQHSDIWAIFDDRARLGLPDSYTSWTPQAVSAEVSAGRAHRAETLEGLAAAIAVPPHALVETVRRWNAQLAGTGRDDDFERHITLGQKNIELPLAPIVQAAFYAVRMYASELVCTHAGMEINPLAEVIDNIGLTIPGLYAAGESGGGVLGHRYIGGGNAVANALTMGRIAGLNAAKFAKSHAGQGQTQ